MFIHTSRRTVASVDSDSVLASSIDIAETAETITDIPVTVWASPYSLGGSSVVWSSRFDSIRELDKAQATLLSSEQYLESLRQITTSFSDPQLETLAEVFLGAPPVEPAPYLTVLEACALPSHQREAIDWGLRLRGALAHGLGVPVSFAVTVFGKVGGMVWLVYHQDADSLQTANAKMLADERIPLLLDEASHFLQPDMSHLMMRRLN